MAKKGTLQASKQNRLKQEAERKADFFTRFKKIINDIGGEGTYNLIPTEYLDVIYFCRCPSLRMIKSDDIPFTDKALKKLNKSFSELTRQHNVSGFLNNYQISIRDFITIWLSLHRFLNISDLGQFEWAKELFIRLEDCKSDERRERYFVSVSFFLILFTNHIGRPMYEFVWPETSFDYYDERNSVAWLFKLRMVKIVPRSVKYLNEHRTAYPAMYNKNGVTTVLQYDLNTIGIKTNLANTMVDVCILEHAMNRVYERLNMIPQSYLKAFCFSALNFPIFHYESENRFLITVKAFETKVGYFVAEYVDGIILVRTFLFLTNNGTPEGRRLNQLTGLSKIDKKYLQIDQLKAFYDSDIAENESLKQLFIDAGCGSLFEVKDNFEDSDSHILKIASYIDKYLRTGLFDDDLDTELDD